MNFAPHFDWRKRDSFNAILLYKSDWKYLTRSLLSNPFICSYYCSVLSIFKSLISLCLFSVLTIYWILWDILEWSVYLGSLKVNGNLSWICIKPEIQFVFALNITKLISLFVVERAHAPVPALWSSKRPPCLHFDPQGTCV